MDRRTKWIAGGAVALVVIGGGTGVAIATGAADNDGPSPGRRSIRLARLPSSTRAVGR